ncbi:c-type cytochrome [Campylobacter sputorum]|uniref:c-type cytochrome n=1 Tax=Campylobacter sputorum TaxID=206 RepID=UPI001E34833D|nr:c-type cytochrome [Campylobacter sputorum]
MKELKILIIVLFMVLVTYWGVEPLAHSVMNPHTSSASYDFSSSDKEFVNKKVDLSNANIKKAGNDEANLNLANKELEKATNLKTKYDELWGKVDSIDFSKGNITSGEQTFAMACASCHSLKVKGLSNPMGDDKTASEAMGVVPPDLSLAGYLYDDKFLAALILEPTVALKVSHVFNDEKPFPMTQFFGLGGDINQEVADIIAYLNSVAPKEASNKEVFDNACQRCHDMKYDNMYVLGDRLSLKNHIGSNPPDLSMMIRSKGETYLHKFINDPQKMLPGTAMPRVGLNEKAEKQVVEYMQKVGDSKKDERESVSIKIMIYFAILSVFAILWKRKIWKDLH